MSENKTIAIGDYLLTTIVTSPPWFENCYLLRHAPSNDALIVDPGGDGERILDALRIDGGRLVGVLLTHGHPDHIAAAPHILESEDVPCLAHVEEKPVIEAASGFAAMLGFPGMQGPGECEWFEGEPELKLGETIFQVRHTPGHTPGGVCYLFDGFALTGDTLFNQGIGRTDFPGGHTQTLYASIDRLLRDLPGETLLFSGHGPAWTAREAREWWRVMAD